MEVYRSIRGITPEVAGVIITGYGSMEVAMEAIRLGFSGFVTKPFAPEALALAVGQALARRRLERENARLRALIPLLELSRAFMGTTDLDELLNQVVHVARRETKADRVSLMLLDEASGELTIEASVGLHRAVVTEAKEKIGKGIAGLVMKRGEPLLLNDETPIDPRIREAMNRGEISSALCVPLKVKDRVIGVLNLAKLGGPPFTEGDLEMVSILCGQAAIAIENARLYAEVNRLAITDALTGLYNRRWFDIQLDKEFNRAIRYGHPLSLAMVEVDHLKKINDTWGHQVGDLVLQTIGRVLKANSRQMDVICRYGGDEIAIIMPETNREGALRVGERLRALIEEAPIEAGVANDLLSKGGIGVMHITETIRKTRQGMEDVSVTISLGVATYPTDAANKEELIRRADQACYLAKQRGRNRVCSWSECSAAEQG